MYLLCKQTHIPSSYLSQTLTLQEALNVDRLGRQDGVGAPAAFSDSGSTPAHPAVTSRSEAEESSMPTSFTQAAPLNEAELLALLMASPLYQKLEKVKRAVASGALQNAPASSGEFDGETLNRIEMICLER